LAWETLLPTCRPLPVSSQTRDMVLILIVRVRTAWARRAQPVSLWSFARQRCAVPRQWQLHDNIFV
jgi:hypothetical protein